MEDTKNIIEIDTEKIERILTHIQNVQRNCYALGLKLIKLGRTSIGRQLIANGQIHDNSKFKGIEFADLFEGSPILNDVVSHHQSVNPHHPEYWDDITDMPEVYIAEMVCDWASRSAEMGTGLRDFIKDTQAPRYKFQLDDTVGKEITYFVNLLLVPTFKKLTPNE